MLDPHSIHSQVTFYYDWNHQNYNQLFHRLLEGGAAVGMDFDKAPFTGITGAETRAFDEDAATIASKLIFLVVSKNIFTLGQGAQVFSICCSCRSQGIKHAANQF